MTDAIYNEIDPFACRWLGELAARGHIAAGRVEQRSIVDLAAADVAGPGQRHLFAGIGAWSYALRLAGIPDDADVWTCSCPCQPFSGAGRRGGVDDKRHLWPDAFRLIAECRPAIVFGEQVASRDGLAWLDLVRADLEGAGYAFGAADLCAAGVGAPHIRQRLYFVAYAGGERLEGLRLQLRERRPRPTMPEAGGRHEASIVVDGDSSRLEVGRVESARREFETAERSGATSVVGHAGSEGSGRNSGAIPRAQSGAEWRVRSEPDVAVAASDIGKLADAERERSGSRRIDGSHGRSSLESDRHGAVGELADSKGHRRDEGRRAVEERTGPRGDSAARVVENADEPHPVHGTQPRGWRLVQPTPHATAGSWSPADWIPCTDGKSRPVEPGTFPLAHGAAARVGRLRGYGNAIVAEVAATFIEAALVAIGDA